MSEESLKAAWLDYLINIEEEQIMISKIRGELGSRKTKQAQSDQAT